MMEIPTRREPPSVSIQPEQTSHNEPIKLLTIESTDDLNTQWKKCLQNLQLCVEAAERAAQVDYFNTLSIIRPAQRMIRERCLRLSIWMTDCGVNDESLSAKSIMDNRSLFGALLSLLSRVQADSIAIFEHFQELENIAREEAEPDFDIGQRERYIREGKSREALAGDNIDSRGDDLARCLYELAGLQDSVRMTLATEGKGPNAELHDLVMRYREKLSADGKSSYTATDRASNASGDEQCSKCHKWFPTYALPLHQEGCMETLGDYCGITVGEGQNPPAFVGEEKSGIPTDKGKEPETSRTKKEPKAFLSKGQKQEERAQEDSTQQPFLRRPSIGLRYPFRFILNDKWSPVSSRIEVKTTKEVVISTDYIKCIEGDLSMERLSRLQKFLWVAGQLKPPHALHHQLVLGREIIVTEQMDLHLVSSAGRILIKPIPQYLFTPDLWSTHLSCRNCVFLLSVHSPCNHRQLLRCALGLLSSYVPLVAHKSDFLIAIEKHLLPAGLTWQNWASLVEDMHNEFDAHERFQYGELSLTRLQFLWLLFSTDELYWYRWNWWNWNWCSSRQLMLVMMSIIVVLVAMQVGLWTDALRDDHAFQSASYGFAVFSIVALVAVLVLVLLSFCFSCTRGVLRLRWRRKTRATLPI